MGNLEEIETAYRDEPSYNGRAFHQYHSLKYSIHNVTQYLTKGRWIRNEVERNKRLTATEKRFPNILQTV